MSKLSSSIDSNGKKIIDLSQPFGNKPRKSAGLYFREELDFYNKFCRFGYIDPYNTVETTREYIFFTKPDLHIFSGNNENTLNPQISEPMFKDAFDMKRDTLKQLQMSLIGNRNPFMNLLSATVRSSLDLPGISASETESAANVSGEFLGIRRTSNTSDHNHEFSLEFEDTKWLDVYMTFKLWDEYYKLKHAGNVTPTNRNYILNKVAYDQISIYKFIVAEDMETIIHYSKLWGVYPTSVPRDVFNNMEGVLKVPIDFKAQFVKDMDPLIISDFNKLVYKHTMDKSVKFAPLYEAGTVDGDWVGMPVVTYAPHGGRKVGGKESPAYKLRWRKG